MKKSLLFLSLFFAIYSPLALTQSAHSAHQHGVAQMNLNIEEKDIEIEFISPLANLISFEHPPQTESQKQELITALEKLKNTELLFNFPNSAQCELANTEFRADFIDTPNHTSIHQKHDNEDFGDHDGNLIMSWQFTCKNEVKPNRLQINFFETFPGTHQIDVQMVTPQGQFAKELTSTSSVLEW